MRPVAYPSRGSGAVALVGVAMMSSRDGPRMRARRKNSAVVMRSSVADGGGQGLSWQPNRSVTRRTARIASFLCRLSGSCTQPSRPMERAALTARCDAQP
uniref:Uncharacterized protein n=1 Tax=Timema genevievae TaxID=629358 RepID=A0A7R9K068_TIMGE|nr:unnamed protein product [Timema genevievae]